MYSSSITKTPATRYNMEGIKDMIPTLWSPIIIAYDKDAALGISHWGPQRQQFYRAMINKVSKHKVFSTMRILSVVSVQFKEGDFLDLYLNDIEDMMLLIAQNKLFNLDGDVIVDFLIALKMFTQGIIVKNRVEDVQLEPYTLNYDPPRIIYEDKSKKKRLMRLDEIHKFCDGTLQSVSKILRERLLNFKFGSNKYMHVREWTTKDKKRTSIMLNKIDDLLFKRRVLRSSEVLVGGRKIEMDKRLLQRTNRRDLPMDILLDSIEVHRRSDTYAGNPVKEVLLNLNLPDHKSVLTEPEGHVKMEMEIPRSSRVKFITACSYSIHKYKDMMKAQVLIYDIIKNNKPDCFSEADFKYLNKNDIEDMYYLCLNKKVNCRENKLLNSLMTFIRNRKLLDEDQFNRSNIDFHWY
ncbi:hypothetical protein Tco_0632602 [Tanacetum coccineum]